MQPKIALQVNQAQLANRELWITKGVFMQSRHARIKLLTVMMGFFCALVVLSDKPAFAQKNDPLVDDRPVTITRKKKVNRRRVRRVFRPVEKAVLLKLEWRVYKVRDDGSQEETSPLAVFHNGDRLRVSVRTNQDGYLYIVHQAAPTAPGQIIFPDSRLNNGNNVVSKSQEFVLPSNCPAAMQRRDCALVVTPPAGQELFHLIFTRDPFTDLPNTASEATGGIPPEALMKLKADSGQVLKRSRGSSPLSVLVTNTNTRDNEDIFETLVLNKGQ
jgi:hypothetical protein